MCPIILSNIVLSSHNSFQKTQLRCRIRKSMAEKYVAACSDVFQLEGNCISTGLLHDFNDCLWCNLTPKRRECTSARKKLNSKLDLMHMALQAQVKSKTSEAATIRNYMPQADKIKRQTFSPNFVNGFLKRLRIAVLSQKQTAAQTFTLSKQTTWLLSASPDRALTSLICRCAVGLLLLSRCVQFFDKVWGKHPCLAVEASAPPAFFNLWGRKRDSNAVWCQTIFNSIHSTLMLHNI